MVSKCMVLTMPSLKQEAQLLHSDHATQYVSRNLDECCTAV